MTEPESDSPTEGPIQSLDCPHGDCSERFRTSHDEHAISSLVYHLRKDHPTLLSDLRSGMGVVRDA